MKLRIETCYLSTLIVDIADDVILDDDSIEDIVNTTECEMLPTLVHARITGDLEVTSTYVYEADENGDEAEGKDPIWVRE